MSELDDMVEATRKNLGRDFRFVKDNGQVTFDSKQHRITQKVPEVSNLCPFCHRVIDDPDKLKHLTECQKQEEQLWNARLKGASNGAHS
jgi:hypothetical protein